MLTPIRALIVEDSEDDAELLLRELRRAGYAPDYRRVDTPEEFVLADLQAARACFDELVGARTSADILEHIFERFCIGK